ACFISLEAAAAVRVIDALLCILLYGPHLHRMTDTGARDFRRIYRRGLLLTVLACLPAALCVAFSPVPHLVPPGMVAGAIGAGVVLWLLGLWLLRHPLLGQIGLFLPARMRRSW
ncbi:MAG: hypothetical protein AB7E60_15425, partial [Sphingobium sp.]